MRSDIQILLTVKSSFIRQQKRRMEIQTNIINLPSRPLAFYSGLRARKCITNQYPITLSLRHKIYQSSLKFEPAIPSDSTELIAKIWAEAKRKLKERLGRVLVRHGTSVMSYKRNDNDFIILVGVTIEEKQRTFQVKVRESTEFPLPELMANLNLRKQMLNGLLKELARNKKMVMLSPNKYFFSDVFDFKDSGLCYQKGFSFTVKEIKMELRLEIDSCISLSQKENLLQQIKKNKSIDYDGSLIGATVITNYGNRRRYKIIQIHREMNPLNKFKQKSTDIEFSFLDYFDIKYGLKVSIKNQPLIEVFLRKETRILEGGAQQKFDVTGFLIPEFVSLTGLSNQQRENYKAMKELPTLSKLKPEIRMQQNQKFIADTFKNDIEIGNPIEVTAFQAIHPQIKLGSQILKNFGDAAFSLRHKLRQIRNLENWLIVYSRGKNRKDDDNKADEFVKTIDEAKKALGIEVKPPTFLYCESNLQSWREEIKNDLKSHNIRPQLIVLFFRPQEIKFYSSLKRILTCEFGIPSQAVRISSKNLKLGIASKILLQMHQKIGGTAWTIIPNPQNSIYKKKVMCAGISFSGGLTGKTLGLVGSTDSAFSKVCSFWRTQCKEVDKQMSQICCQWAETYLNINKEPPQMIILYRQGLSISQIKRQGKQNLQAIRSMINHISQQLKINSYHPEIIIVGANTRPGSRYYDLPISSTTKFRGQVENPRAGTIVREGLSEVDLFDFHLTSQAVTEGTSNPVQYIVLNWETRIREQELVQFTYDQCYNYPNWSGGVKLPATLQCANKLSKLIGEHIQKDLLKGDILRTYHFL